MPATSTFTRLVRSAARRSTAHLGALLSSDPFHDARPAPRPVNRVQLEEACGWDQLRSEHGLPAETNALAFASLRPSCLFPDRYLLRAAGSPPTLLTLERATEHVRVCASAHQAPAQPGDDIPTEAHPTDA